MSTIIPQPRPYRSHRIPACDKCRQRKIRCKIEVPGQPCELCADRRFDCAFSGTGTGTCPSFAANPRRRRKRSRSANVPFNREGLNPEARTSNSSAAETYLPVIAVSVRSSPSLAEKAVAPASFYQGGSSSNGASTNAGGCDEGSIIVGPIVAEDVHILQRYLIAGQCRGAVSPRSKQPYSVVSSTPGNPMIYLAVPRHREGQKFTKDPGRGQREVLDQILGPIRQDILQLYFTHIHPAFPVLDEEAFFGLEWRDGRMACRVPSSSLLCEVYAISLTFWNHSDALKHHHVPSEQYFWSEAIAALQEEFLAPTLPTLYSAMVELLGRPVRSLQQNVVNAGRTMALVHSLGLNRDPSLWKIEPRDKHVRIRVFWGCMILDQWSSFAHGVPPSILRRQYDVPLPTMAILLTPGKETEERARAAECFIQLCKLSQVLGDVLSLVYDLGGPRKEVWRDLRRLENALDDWDEYLPDFLQPRALENGVPVSGAGSLRFGYLSIRMLLCRISLQAATRENEADAHDIRQYHLATLRRAATRIADFVCSRQSSHLRGFWLSFTGHLLVSAATILLRCIIDTTDAAVAEGCKSSLKALQERLHLAKTQDNWDLADMFIKHCDDPISRVVGSLGSEVRNNDDEIGTTATAVQHLDENQHQQQVPRESSDPGFYTYSELNIPIGSLDYQWESLWDMLEEPQGAT